VPHLLSHWGCAGACALSTCLTAAVKQRGTNGCQVLPMRQASESGNPFTVRDSVLDIMIFNKAESTQVSADDKPLVRQHLQECRMVV
jgi:hypothetical protein